MAPLQKILRRTFYTAAAISTLLLLATLILWPVSYYRNLFIENHARGESESSLGAVLGRVVFQQDNGPDPLPASFSMHCKSISAYDRMSFGWTYLVWYWKPLATLSIRDVECEANLLGVILQHFPSGLVSTGPVSYTEIIIPLSYLTLLFSILPLLAFRSIRRRRKLARIGLCQKCGYDLRASLNRCPECGTPIPTPPPP